MSLEAIIPHMTNNNTPAPFIASTSNQLASYAPFNAFQDNGGAWISDVANSYIQIDLGRPYKVSKVFIDTDSSWTGAKMKTLTLQASTNGIDWTNLYVGATTNYKYVEEKDFGVYRYWRTRAGAMTSRGGCVRYFQLYGASSGFTDLDVNNIWVTTVSTVFKGTVYAVSGQMDVRVLINDVVEDDWHTFDGIIPVEYEYDPSLFREGGNVVTIQCRDDKGVITEETYLLYKLDFDIYNFNTSSYDFKIKNSPLRPSNDGWLSQHYVMDYLNSELGVSYVFRFKPYAQVDSRLEERPRLFDRILKENYNIESNQLFSSRTTGKHGLKQEDKPANVRRLLDTIKSDQFKLGFKDIGIIQRVFDSWAAMNTESIAVKPDLKNLATKKMKVSQDVLRMHNLNSRRKDMIQNALTMIQGYEFSNRKVFGTVVEYYRAMEDFYPHKETILGGLLINAISKENIAVMYPVLNAGQKNKSQSTVISASSFSKKEEGLGEHGEYKNAIIVVDDEAIINQLRNSVSIPRGNNTIMNEPLFGSKEELYGTTPSYSLATTEDGEGTLYDVLMSIKNENKETYTKEVVGAHKDDESKEVKVIQSVLVNKNQKTKEFRVNDVEFISKLNVDAYVEELREFIELLPIEATEKAMWTFVDKMSSDSQIIRSLDQVNLMPVDARLTDTSQDFFDAVSVNARLYENMVQYIDKMPLLSDDPIAHVFVDKLSASSWILEDSTQKVDKLAKDIRVIETVMFIHKASNKEAWPIFNEMFVDKGGRNTNLLISDTFLDKTYKNVYNFDEDISYVDKVSHIMFHDEMLRTVDKLSKQALIWTVLTNINAIDKASIVHANWELATKVIEKAKAIDDAVRFGDKEEKFTYLYDDDLAYIEDKKGLIIDQLLLDHIDLNGYILDLIGTELDRDVENTAIKLEEILSDKDVAMGYIQEGIDANRRNQEKEGYIPENTFVLAGDGSDWEDIWDRYSPGVDILDPPDSDYDYSKLAPAIYDMATGVPKFPIGPSNKSDVYVQTATSHPIPDNDTVGVDDTKRIAVDNYIFIDCVLALESIKNRQKLRYAGMPVGKAIKEVFSQLYTWIQQAAPGHKEYERMFRFSRWYAEAVVLRNSKQILHRVYNPWQSSLHMGSGLGVDHVKHGWTYMTGTGTLDTTALSAHLIFSKENYIDSEFVLRGYFDNPAGKGTMEISVDGVVVDSFSSHGVYERRIEIPQGHHSYDIFFYGTSGAAVISSIEIGGTNFVSAHTTSDDSDVNGLKALTELMAQLLGYFELHHGGRKVKGTMEVRQRAVWNTHT